MEQEPKFYSQIFDHGVRSGIIGQIDKNVFLFLVALASCMKEDGTCYPRLETIAKYLEVSKRTAGIYLQKAKKTIYRGVPVLVAHQQKEMVGGKLAWSSNLYKISQPIRDDLITRYYSVYLKLPTEKIDILQGKSELPEERFAYTEKVPTNDNYSENKIYINDKDRSLINKSLKGENEVEMFGHRVDNAEDERIYQIALWLGEERMNFLISCKKDLNCGIRGIEWAFGITKEDWNKGGVKSKGKLFNFYIKKYKEKKVSE